MAGGVEVLSNVPITYSRKAADFLVAMSKAKSSVGRLKVLKNFSLKDWLPRPPALSEPLTGYTMGQHAEQMAKLNTISREEQDKFALRSHEKAAAAVADGKFAEEIFPIWVGDKYQRQVNRDDLIRVDSDLDTMSRLRPSFDRKYGTITAASSSPLTDGAAISLIADQKCATELGLKVRAKILDYMFVGAVPYKQLLIAPALLIPLLMRKHKLNYKDIDLFEVHEAFAAQVLSCQRSLSSADFFLEHFGNKSTLGEVPEDKLNVNGGAIAIGHPFGATGSRMLTNMVNELGRRDKTLGLIAICAAGGMGGGMLVERVN